MRTAQKNVDCATHSLISPQLEKTSGEPPKTRPHTNANAFCAIFFFSFFWNDLMFPWRRGNLSHQKMFCLVQPLELFPAETQLVSLPHRTTTPSLLLEAFPRTFGMKRDTDSYIKANEWLALYWLSRWGVLR